MKIQKLKYTMGKDNYDFGFKVGDIVTNDYHTAELTGTRTWPERFPGVLYFYMKPTNSPFFDISSAYYIKENYRLVDKRKE